MQLSRVRPTGALVSALVACTVLAAQSHAVNVVVPGTSNPYLAGMPDGTIARVTDVAPAQSPVLVSGLCLHAGSALNFSATGGTSNDPMIPLVGPEGNVMAVTAHALGAEHGIADLTAPYNSLCGVFLDASQPDLTAAPAGLSFATPASRDFLSISPVLKQPFFIGDGKTSLNVVQQFVVPAGATRLFLGTLECCNWNNNPGSLQVEVFDPCPTPVEPQTWTVIKHHYR